MSINTSGESEKILLSDGEKISDGEKTILDELPDDLHESFYELRNNISKEFDLYTLFSKWNNDSNVLQNFLNGNIYNSFDEPLQDKVEELIYYVLDKSGLTFIAPSVEKYILCYNGCIVHAFMSEPEPED